jgi:hypothetical protein
MRRLRFPLRLTAFTYRCFEQTYTHHLRHTNEHVVLFDWYSKGLKVARRAAKSKALFEIAVAHPCRSAQLFELTTAVH